jgi:hypothetical protein
MSGAMSRSGRPLLAGGSAVADGKNISKLSRRALASRRAADRAKLLANLAGDRAGCPASSAAGAPSTPSTPTLPQTRSERYALRSAEKSIAKTLAEPSSPDGSERSPLATANPLAPVTSVVDDNDNDNDNDEVDDCSSGGDQRMEFQRRQRDAASSAMAQLKSPPLEVVFQPPNDPGVNNGAVADSVLDMALLEPPPADSVLDDMFSGIVVLALTRTWAKQKGHMPCAMTLIRLEQDYCWIHGRLVNWKHVPPSHCAKWLPLPPPRRTDAQRRMSCTSVLVV